LRGSNPGPEGQVIINLPLHQSAGGNTVAPTF